MNSPITFRVLCTCGKPLSVSRANIGKKGRCPTCKAMFVIPEPPKEGRNGHDITRGKAESEILEDIELQLELDLPNPTRSSKSRRRDGGAPTAPEFGLVGKDVFPAAAVMDASYRGNSSKQPYRQPKSSSGFVGPLAIVIGILAGLFLLGGTIVGSVNFIQSYTANLPKAIPVPVYGDEVSEKEATDAGERWIQQAVSREFIASDAKSVFDENQMYCLALERVELSPQVRVDAISKMQTILKSLCSLATNENDEASVIKSTLDKIAPIVSIRIYNQKSGDLSYVNVRCRRSEDLEVRACDIDFLNGKGWVSEQLKRNLFSIAKAKQAVLDTFAPIGVSIDDSMVDRLITVCALPAADAAKRVAAFNELIRVYADQPSALRAYALSNAEDGQAERFRSAYLSFKTKYPSDPSLTLFAMRFLASHGIYGTLENDIEDLEKIIGSDPYLDWYRVLALAANNRYDESKALLNQVVEKPWAPEIAKPLLEFANNPKGPRPTLTLPLLGNSLATNKWLFVKPKTQEEIAREQADSEAAAYEAESAMVEAAQRAKDRQDKSAMEANSQQESKRIQAEMDAQQRYLEAEKRAADRYEAAQQAAQKLNEPRPGF